MFKTMSFSLTLFLYWKSLKIEKKEKIKLNI